MSEVIWHDLECGSYGEDLPLWRELARRCGSPILDVGAGTGRVTLVLARDGHELIALDREPELLAELERRAAGLEVETLLADARSFSTAVPVPLILVPMQTIQLLGGAEQRTEFLIAARESIAPGGTLAIAIADPLQEAYAGDEVAPLPDMREIDGLLYSSRPIAIVDEGERCAIHRIREVVRPDGTRTEEENIVRLDRVSADELEREARAVDFQIHEREEIPETDVYVGSTVVMLRG